MIASWLLDIYARLVDVQMTDRQETLQGDLQKAAEHYASRGLSISAIANSGYAEPVENRQYDDSVGTIPRTRRTKLDLVGIKRIISKVRAKGLGEAGTQMAM